MTTKHIKTSHSPSGCSTPGWGWGVGGGGGCGLGRGEGGGGEREEGGGLQDRTGRTISFSLALSQAFGASLNSETLRSKPKALNRNPAQQTQTLQAPRFRLSHSDNPCEAPRFRVIRAHACVSACMYVCR